MNSGELIIKMEMKGWVCMKKSSSREWLLFNLVFDHTWSVSMIKIYKNAKIFKKLRNKRQFGLDIKTVLYLKTQ